MLHTFNKMGFLSSITNWTRSTRLLCAYSINFRSFCVASRRSGQKIESSSSQSLATEEKKSDVQRSLHVAVIGVPNAGKSTFINSITNHRVCPVSSKVHTTRKANKAIYSTGNTQLIFSDTPGLVTEHEIKKHNLEKEFISGYRNAIQNSDIIAVLHDVSNTWTRNTLHNSVLSALKMYPSKPSVLLLNKIDSIKSKRILLDLPKETSIVQRILTNNNLQSRNSRVQIKNSSKDKGLGEESCGWSYFEDVFMISAVTGNGIPEIQNYLLHNAKNRNWLYGKNCFTDETPEMLVVESVRARLLDYLPQEIPYNLQTSIEYYSEENNTIYASVIVTSPTERIERLICGESNGKLFQITERVTSDLVETFGKAVSLTITTKAKRNKQI